MLPLSPAAEPTSRVPRTDFGDAAAWAAPKTAIDGFQQNTATCVSDPAYSGTYPGSDAD